MIVRSSFSRAGKSAFAGMILLFGAARGFAALAWKTTDLALTAKLGQPAVTATFPFTNTGETPVRITEIVTSCGCLTTKLAKEVWGPGESGELTAELSTAGLVGRRENTITLVSDDRPGKPQILSVALSVPEAFVVQPRFVFWRKGEKAEPKSIAVTLHDPATMRITAVKAMSPGVSARLSPGASPGAYAIVVVPADTTQTLQTTLQLKVTVGGEETTSLIYVAVK